MPLSEHVYCVAVTFKKTEWIEQWICIEFHVKLEYSSEETIWTIQKATAMGNWWLAIHHNMSSQVSWVKSFCKTLNHPCGSVPLQSRFGILRLLAFPQTKITFGREETSDHWWDSRQYGNRQLMVIGGSMWETKVPTLKGNEASLSYVQSFLYLVSF